MVPRHAPHYTTDKWHIQTQLILFPSVPASMFTSASFAILSHVHVYVESSLVRGRQVATVCMFICILYVCDRQHMQ